MPTPLTSSRTSTFSLSQRSNDVRIDSLLDGTKWGGALHTGVTLTYSFPGATSYWDTPYGSGEPTQGGFHVLDAADEVIVRKAMSFWSMYSNLRLVETGDTSANVGDVRIAKTAYGHTGSDVAAHAYQPTANSWSGKIAGANNRITHLESGKPLLTTDPATAIVYGRIAPVVAPAPLALIAAPTLLVESNYDSYEVQGSADVSNIHWWTADGLSNALFSGAITLTAAGALALVSGGNLRLAGGAARRDVAAGSSVRRTDAASQGFWRPVS